MVPLGHSVEQRARRGEVALRAGERRDESVVGAAVRVRDGREEGEGVWEGGGLGGEEVEEAVGEEEVGGWERGGGRGQSACGRDVISVGAEQREEAVDGVVELGRGGDGERRGLGLHGEEVAMACMVARTPAAARLAT